jgi:hypothetical protein
MVGDCEKFHGWSTFPSMAEVRLGTIGQGGGVSGGHG